MDRIIKLYKFLFQFSGYLRVENFENNEEKTINQENSKDVGKHDSFDCQDIELDTGNINENEAEVIIKLKTLGLS